MVRRWLFGDHLGPHFLDGDEQPVLLIESQRVFRRRRFHRQKAQLILSAMRHRAAELGARCDYRRVDRYGDALADTDEPLEVIQPTSWAAVHFVERLATEREINRLPARGYATSRADFDTWADARGGKRLLMEDFYRDARIRHDVLLEGSGSSGGARGGRPPRSGGGEPVAGRWNFDADNREPPPKTATLGVPEPHWPVEDEIDAEVRADLDRWAAEEGVEFVGEDGPRLFAATRDEALGALDDFIAHRLPDFGRYEDAILRQDRWMAHSLISAPMNLGLLDPIEVVRAAEEAYAAGEAPIAAVEGFIRQVMGWRDYIWHLYWYLGEDYRHGNELGAHRPLPQWMNDLDPAGTEAACLKSTITAVREDGWTHHIPRLMVLGNYGLQQGWDPLQLTDWFHRSFFDGYDWVMVPNVVGMSQYADGGVLATKPYVAGGNYINTMSDHCGSCVYDPKIRVGEKACPFAGGYWRFLHRHRERFAANVRMRQMLRGLDRLKDLDQIIAESDAP